MARTDNKQRESYENGPRNKQVDNFTSEGGSSARCYARRKSPCAAHRRTKLPLQAAAIMTGNPSALPTKIPSWLLGELIPFKRHRWTCHGGVCAVS